MVKIERIEEFTYGTCCICKTAHDKVLEVTFEEATRLCETKDSWHHVCEDCARKRGWVW